MRLDQLRAALRSAGYSEERLRRLETLTDDEYYDLLSRAAALPQRVELSDTRSLAKLSTTGHAAYRGADGMVVMVSWDPTPHGLLQHVSVSYAARLPRWQDMIAVRDAFFGADVDVVIVLPRRGKYINFHKYCLHMFQTPTEWQGDIFV